MEGPMKELLEYLAKSLVRHPEEVRVEVAEDDDNVNLVLYVAGDDLGKVIGRQGRIARAIRTVMKAAAVNDGRRVNVDIME